MTSEIIQLGAYGEGVALDFLKEQGFKIRERNFKTKLGEIDIVAEESGTICFIEVKTRKSFAQGDPVEAISKNKQFKLSQMALNYLMEKKLDNKDARFDVVSIMIDTQGRKRIEIIKNAFDLSDHFYQ